MNGKLKQIRLQQLKQAQNVKAKSLYSETAYYYEHILELVYSEEKPNTLRQLLELDLLKPFPYQDTSKMQDDFKIKEQFLEDDCLNGDLNTYWMNIHGSLSYILIGRSQKIPQGQIDWLQMSFFDIFKQYRFLEESIEKYPIFYEHYINYEKARILILLLLVLQR